MPINVIRLEIGRKKRLHMAPHVYLQSVKFGEYDLKLGKGPGWVTGLNAKAGDILDSASDVYVTSEVDDKFKQTNKRVDEEVRDLKANIADSITSISQKVGDMSAAILTDQTFRKAIVDEVIKELERRGALGGAAPTES